MCARPPEGAFFVGVESRGGGKMKARRGMAVRASTLARVRGVLGAWRLQKRWWLVVVSRLEECGGAEVCKTVCAARTDGKGGFITARG